MARSVIELTRSTYAFRTLQNQNNEFPFSLYKVKYTIGINSLIFENVLLEQLVSLSVEILICNRNFLSETNPLIHSGGTPIKVEPS